MRPYKRFATPGQTQNSPQNQHHAANLAAAELPWQTNLWAAFGWCYANRPASLQSGAKLRLMLSSGQWVCLPLPEEPMKANLLSVMADPQGWQYGLVKVWYGKLLHEALPGAVLARMLLASGCNAFGRPKLDDRMAVWQGFSAFARTAKTVPQSYCEARPCGKKRWPSSVTTQSMHTGMVSAHSSQCVC